MRLYLVVRTPRSWPRLPPIRQVDRQRQAPRRCRGSRKHHRWPGPPVAAEAAAKPARSYLRAILTSPGTFVTRQDVLYREANEVWFSKRAQKIFYKKNSCLNFAQISEINMLLSR